MKRKILKKEYFLILFLFIFTLSKIMKNPLGDLDEIWNYNVARNIANGLIPYKDISTITTPLMPMINSIFLKIFGDELIVMRVLAAILGTSILYTIFKKNIDIQQIEIYAIIGFIIFLSTKIFAGIFFKKDLAFLNKKKFQVKDGKGK